MWLTLLAKSWRYIVAFLLILAVSGFLMSMGARIERNRLQPKIDALQTTLNTERAGHKRAMEEVNERRESDLAAANQLREAARTHLEERVHFHATTADALRQRLRNAERNRVHPLAPAETAPADCSNYEADPTRLSESARDFLIREAAGAEAIGEYLLTCRKEYAAARLACGVRSEH